MKLAIAVFVIAAFPVFAEAPQLTHEQEQAAKVERILHPLFLEMQTPAKGEKTRGGEQITLPIPMHGSDGGDHVNWTELSAMLAILGAVVGGIQWLIVRAMIEPAMLRQTEALKVWAKEEFPSAEKVSAHIEADEKQQEHVGKEMERMWGVINQRK